MQCPFIVEGKLVENVCLNSSHDIRLELISLWMSDQVIKENTKCVFIVTHLINIMCI